MTAATITPTAHPAWCTDHDGFDDGSSDWHRSAAVPVVGGVVYLTTGTITGDAEIVLQTNPSEPITVAEARNLAHALLRLSDATVPLSAAGWKATRWAAENMGTTVEEIFAEAGVDHDRATQADFDLLSEAIDRLAKVRE